MNFKIQTKGFTLIELLVTISIIIILSALIIPNYSSGSKRMALGRAAYKLSQDIRWTQELAVSSQATVCSSGTLKGYGIYFNKIGDDKEEYIIFAECNDTEPNYDYDAGSDDIISGGDIKIEKGIEISKIEKNSTSLDNISVIFIPPDPTTYIEHSNSGYEAKITLCIGGADCGTADYYKVISVNNSGRIKIE